MKASNKAARPFVAGLFAGAIGLLAIVAIAGLAVVYSGAYNVAATEDHVSATRWAFQTTMRRSVQNRAADSKAPSDFDQKMVRAGAEDYRSMCEHCHAAPGHERASWADGMRPLPPRLTEAAAGWKVNEVLWIAKHGIRMTGMPAFGPMHSDEKLWRIAAFVRELPAMTPERYAELAGSDGRAQDADGHTR